MKNQDRMRMTTEQQLGPGRLRRRVSGAARRAARRARRTAAARRLMRPTVSIILPVYNVEDYLAECLASIADQGFQHYEVVVVDDGSPDGSRAIAEKYARSDSRIRIVTRENGGLGAARNTGVREARGKYLTFVDSDDVLPPNALSALVESARATGSDIVVGSVRRFDGVRNWRPQWVESVHAERRTAITVTEFLPLLRNLYTWNKLFRRDFWDRCGLWFREGVAYEDQPIITQLYARAGSIDVLPDPVYRYRAREDKSSISQQTATVKDLRDRIAAWQASREVLLREAREIYDGWLQTLFDAHLHWYLNSSGTVGDTYWAELQRAVLDFTDDAPDAVWHATSPEKRVLLELARQDRRADAQEFVRVGGTRLDRFESVVRDDGVLVRLPFHGDPRLDESLFLLRPEQLRLAHSVENFHWTGRGVASVTGWAYIRKIDLASQTSTVRVVVRSGSGAEHVFESDGAPPAVFAPPVEDDHCDYGPARFHVELPMADIVDAGSPGETWSVHLQVSTAGFTVTEPVTQLIRSGSAGVIPAASLDGGDRLVAEWQLYEPLRFRVEPLLLEAVDVRLEDRTLTGRLEGPAGRDVGRLAVTAGRSRAEARLVGRGAEPRSFRIQLPPADKLTMTSWATWTVTAVGFDDSVVRISLREGSGPGWTHADPTGALAVQRTRNGELSVTEWLVGAVVDTVEVSRDGVLRASGKIHGSDVEAVALATQHKKTRTHGPDAPLVDGRFTAEVSLSHQLFRFGNQPLPTGDHHFGVRVRRANGVTVEVPLVMSAELNGELPIQVLSAQLEGRAVRGPNGVLRLTLLRPIGDARSRYHQNRLKQSTAGAGRALTRGVLMRSYFGEHATDNGLSIQRELQRRGSDLPVYWAVQDHSIPVPEGGIPVVVNSREFYQLLASVKYYVDNMYQPEFHTKPPGQVVVQTFHGYPFKVMGHRHWENLLFSKARIDAYDKRAAEWDYLVSPARYATPLLTREFAYHGEVLEIGYPRNDVLLSPEADDLRELTRRSLGIAEHQTAVLYAPTFRDYLSTDDSRARMADFFDFERAHAMLGDDYVILVRGHAFHARTQHRVGALPGVVDVTDYPEVSDLYLAADAGIVDYSSLRFDFGVTGKPMIFHVPDLQRYKDTRGWLFDFEPSAPGPLVDTTEQVVEHLLDLDGVRTRHQPQYDEFRASYLDLEDGHAGSRFVDAVFVPRGDA